MLNTRQDAGFVGATALMLMGLGCTSLEDLASYSAGSAGANRLPEFQPPVGEPSGEFDTSPADAGATVAVASEVQSPSNVPLVPSGVAATADDCAAEDEFTDADGGACYLTLAEASSWRDARDACRAWGGELAQVHSSEEHGLISRRSDEDVWLGASDVDEEGLFRWVDGDEVDADGEWGPGQPDNYEGRENCVELRAFDDNWNDVPCVSNKRGMCERALGAAAPSIEPRPAP